MKVKVQFPDGVREVPAYYHMSVEAREHNWCLSPTPEPMEGWEFFEIAGEPRWQALRTR